MTIQFPKDFLWGTATAAHQVEGNNNHSDWWDWEKIPGKIKHGDVSGIACDHWGRFDEDLALMKALGANTYRLSVEWAKIEPKQGVWDEAAIAHYAEVVRKLLASGIEPMITLHHFTSPRWWADKGYWAWEGTAAAFGGYAKLVFERIAPNVRIFTTVNEPLVHLGAGYIMGIMPPEKKGFEHLQAPLLGMLRAHAAAYRALHECASAHGKKIEVGMAHHLRIFDPKHTWNPVDQLVSKIMDAAFNTSVPNALETGRIRVKVPGLLTIDEDIPGLANTQDYFGLNYYSRDLVTLGWKDGSLQPLPTVKKGALVNDLGWELYPEGFLRVLRRVAKHYPGKPIYVTENGLADAVDSRRANFIESHVSAMETAIGEGVPVKAYCHWSLLDNFEWIEGFEPRFGLVEIDYATLARKPRPSFQVYRDLIGRHRNDR
ncbi:MAG: glycoside hydrolase family 1 protein [Cryobacterium sp.]|nr:glycoside hydrolase family 1 protein [Oligoflexia bacterium]